MKTKKAAKKKATKKEKLDLSNLPEDKQNPTHREDFDKVLEMLVPSIEPKAKKDKK